MSLLHVETYDALKAAGTPEAEARAAACVAADMDMRHTVMLERLTVVDSKLTMILWMLGIGLSAVCAAAWEVFSRLPKG